MKIPLYIWGAWAMFAMMAIVAWSARRRSRRIDRLMRESASEQKGPLDADK